MAHRRGLYFMLYFIFFYLLNIHVIGLAYVLGFSPSSADSLWLQIFFHLVTFLVPLTIWLAVFKEKINIHLPHMKLGTTNINCIIGLSFLLQPAAMAISGITSLFFPNIAAEVMVESMENNYFLLILAFAVMPAVCEEVVFRGYVMSTFKHKPFLTLALFNGLFFAISHFHPSQFFYTFFLGIVFAYVVYATQSIRASIIMHFTMNASQTTLTWLSSKIYDLVEILEKVNEETGIQYDFEAVEALDISKAETIAAFVMLGLILVGSTVGAVILMRFFAQHNRKRFLEYEMKQKTEEDTEDIIEETPQEPLKKHSRAVDIALVLVIVALYVFLVFDI